MFRNKLIICLTLFTWIDLHAQNLEADLGKVMKHVDSAHSVSLMATVNVYSKKGGNSFFVANASLKKTQSASWTILDNLEIYTTSEYSFTIDHDEKKASVIKSQDKKNKDLTKGLDIDMKQFKKLLDKEGSNNKAVVNLVSSKGDLRVYSITNIPYIKEVRVTLNMNKLNILSLSYEYTEKSEYKGQYIVVNYTQFSIDEDLTETLRQANFFTVSNGKATLNKRFKGYILDTEL